MYHRENPFPARLIERILLNKEGSTRKTYHLTLDVTEAHFSYKPGDALAIFPENCPKQVEALLEAIGKTGTEEIVDPRLKKRISLENFLKTRIHLNRVSSSLLEKVGLSKPLQKEKVVPVESYDLIDFFQMCPRGFSFQDLVSDFSPLLPRFYSIASSPAVQPNAVDLLVATFSYQQGDKQKAGLSSDYLCHQAPMHTSSIRCYLQPTAHFSLPKDPKTPILMIGPGTGIAPYRAFLQEREAKGYPGKNWLFFGERNRETDYYYQSYLESLVDKNLLSLDLAFSRDSVEKCYVQDRLFQRGEAVWAFLAAGANLYICGNASKMAKQVISTLSLIFTRYGKVIGDSYIKQLRKAKRLLLDVY